MNFCTYSFKSQLNYGIIVFWGILNELGCYRGIQKLRVISILCVLAWQTGLGTSSREEG